jgi:hypothetical protein
MLVLAALVVVPARPNSWASQPISHRLGQPEPLDSAVVLSPVIAQQEKEDRNGCAGAIGATGERF